MTAAAPIPERYIHAGGPIVVIPARVCAYLNRHAGLDQYRRENRGADSEVDAVLVAIKIAELNWRATATGTPEAPQPELDPQLQWLSTTQAADRAGITDRGIRKAIENGQLKAHTLNGRHRIRRDDYEHWHAARAA